MSDATTMPSVEVGRLNRISMTACRREEGEASNV